MQSEEYARFMGEEKYYYDYVGLVTDDGLIKAASLILWRKIGFNMRYGYAPKGFLINYYDENLMQTFKEKLKQYYAKKNMVFIKINPEIVVAQIDSNTFERDDNPNMKLKTDLQRLGYNKLKDNLYFESLNPRFEAYVNLKNTELSHYTKPHRNKVRNSRRKGLYVEVGSIENLEEYYGLTKRTKPLSYYRNLLLSFKDKIDLVLIRVDYEEFIKNSQSLYDDEMDRNSLYNEILHRSKSENDLNRKMASDSKLAIFKQEIITATGGLRNKNRALVAGALVIKDDNRVHVFESTYEENHRHLNANYFLYDSLIQNYKTQFEYLNLGGISGDFSSSNPYYGLSRFKLGFGATIYEYIGEYDLVLSKMSYDTLLSSGRLATEFKKEK